MVKQNIVYRFFEGYLLIGDEGKNEVETHIVYMCREFSFYNNFLYTDNILYKGICTLLK